MIILLDTIILCAVLTAICVLGTGSDDKNIISFASYPDAVQKIVSENPELKSKIKKSSPITVFLSNLFIFIIILFILGLTFRTDSFLTNFLYALIIGEAANLYDLVILDFLWWRHSKRIRFSCIPDASLYLPMKKHVFAFIRGAVMFALAALAVGGLLLLL